MVLAISMNKILLTLMGGSIHLISKPPGKRGHYGISPIAFNRGGLVVTSVPRRLKATDDDERKDIFTFYKWFPRISTVK